MGPYRRDDINTKNSKVIADPKEIIKLKLASEFNKIAKSHAVYPADVEPKNLEDGEELHDQKMWDTSSPMNRKYSQQKLKVHGIIDEKEK